MLPGPTVFIPSPFFLCLGTQDFFFLFEVKGREQEQKSPLYAGSLSLCAVLFPFFPLLFFFFPLFPSLAGTVGSYMLNRQNRAGGREPSLFPPFFFFFFFLSLALEGENAFIELAGGLPIFPPFPFSSFFPPPSLPVLPIFFFFPLFRSKRTPTDQKGSSH